MFFSERQKQLPYLCGYLEYASRLRQPLPVNTRTVGAVVSAGLLLSAPVELLTLGSAPVAIASASLAALAGIVTYRFARAARRGEPVDADQVRLDRESREVVERLMALLKRKRLHRDLSADVGAVIEEAARNWTRARSALESPYWNRPDLSAQLRAIRDQSLSSADRTMQELLVLFAPSVPAAPANWSLAEIADEVVGKQVFASKPNPYFSPFYEDGLRMAQRLSELASESEAISRRLLNDPDLGASNRPGAALEATLMELRSLRVAEEELNQDVRS